MAATIILVGALLAQAAPAAVTVEGAADRVDVGYEELRDGRAHDAIERIRSNKDLEAGDPSALINLGTAHARLGRKDEAYSAYAAAILSDTRYDVQLHDGRWMDSRQAARLAIHYLEDNRALALR
jgi:tetratricopeptide (TPR) repeat protein